ncbi:MAG: transcription-repair coupling factor [Gammaproteobacteria bacterium]
MSQSARPTHPPALSHRTTWSGLRGSALALALASAAKKLDGPMLVLTDSAHESELLANELRFFLNDALPVLEFPDWETLPYDGFSPPQGIVSDRLATLSSLEHMKRGIIISRLSTTAIRLPPLTFVYGSSFMFAPGDVLDVQALRRRLTDAGYHAMSQVNEHGEFAIRGSLFDIFPAGSQRPVRVDLFDEEIETLRYFDAETQRSGETLESLRLLPAREYPLDEAGISQFRQSFRRRFEGNPTDSVIYQHISEGISAAGAEQYLPLFFETTASFFDYLPDNTTIALPDDATGSQTQHWQDIEQRYEQLRYDRTRPLMAPSEIMLPPDEWQTSTSLFNQLSLRRFKDESADVEFSTGTLPELSISSDDHRSGRLIEFIQGFDGRILIVAESPGRRETLRALLSDNQLRPRQVSTWDEFHGSGHTLALTEALVQEGMLLTEARIAVIAENQLFGHSATRKARRSHKSKDPNSIIRNLNELNIGAPVVHELHGVGRYQGLTILEIDGDKNEFLTIEYAGNDKLYVPVHALNFVTRYLGGPPEKAPLHKLGSDQWDKARRKAMSRIRDVAADLLDLYARRAARIGQSFALNEAEYRQFATGFPYELTVDQDTAISAVIDDMTSIQSMDRLVCGDVGFGKTEVALRAAFICVHQSKQVALLVPTTLLAEQHGKNFEDRFADWPIRVEVLSRFKSKKESTRIIEELKDGKVDIVIGTHKLLQADVKFTDLGLVIIDEEQRFGVRHKEQLKALRAEVDMLTLTATPIPRTLNMALGGIRELSLITTPPTDRLSIKTFVNQWNDQLIREACLREINRGGQIYFVHNSVKDIEHIASQLADIIPEATIEIGHGQMKERELERVMLDFYHRRFNLLLCTTIIESGIDVPTANTIIINRADRFGLAQLHQMRGRVGRSSHRAYAYMIAPPVRSLTPDAVKRLEAIESLEDLGAGFTLATHDLEIRGAGELLGDDQSGQIHQIGFTLYMDLLERAVESLKQGHEPDLGDMPARSSEIELHEPALLPDDFIPDVHTRLILYKRITSAENAEELRELQVEMIDRFGLLPDPTKLLFEIATLRQLAQKAGIAKIDCSAGGGRLVFGAHAKLDPSVLIELIQRHPQTYRLVDEHTLRFTRDLAEVPDRLSFLTSLIDTFVTAGDVVN